jgi:hypothetical protein
MIPPSSQGRAPLAAPFPDCGPALAVRQNRGVTETAAAAVEWAVTERGRRIESTQVEVDTALKLLALNGDKPKLACEQLAEEGIDLKPEALRMWRDRSFPRRYIQLRQELAKDVGEDIAGRAMEGAMQALEAQSKYIEAAVDKLDRVPPAHLANNVAALAQAVGVLVEKAQLLRDRPTEITEVRSIDENLAVLERYGVIKRQDTIDAEVLEESDVA